MYPSYATIYEITRLIKTVKNVFRYKILLNLYALKKLSLAANHPVSPHEIHSQFNIPEAGIFQ